MIVLPVQVVQHEGHFLEHDAVGHLLFRGGLSEALEEAIEGGEIDDAVERLALLLNALDEITQVQLQLFVHRTQQRVVCS